MDAVKNELQSLEQQGVISSVVTTEKDGQIIICGDSSTGLNSALNFH